ncbi:MAG TPA: hypothetical protein VGO59_11535 [Verrucomicrobiae bacterium]|jgi:hypothetical protein
MKTTRTFLALILWMGVLTLKTNASSGRDIVKFNTTNGAYVSDFIDNLNAPNELIWDGTNDRFLFSAIVNG